MEPIDTKEIIDELKASAIDRTKVISDLKAKYPIEDFLTYNEFNLQDRLELLPMKIIDFQENLYRETAVYDALIEQRDILLGKLYDYYKFHGDKKLDKYEIKEYYIPTHPNKIAFDKHIRRQKWTVEYFEGCVKALDKMTWIIKDFIKTLQHNI